MGGAVAVLSAQVDALEKTLNSARASATASASNLTSITERAEDVRRQLELQMAALHDVVPAQAVPAAPSVSGSSRNKGTIPDAVSPVVETEPMFMRRRTA